jgi:hypothetical protein
VYSTIIFFFLNFQYNISIMTRRIRYSPVPDTTSLLRPIWLCLQSIHTKYRVRLSYTFVSLLGCNPNSPLTEVCYSKTYNLLSEHLHLHNLKVLVRLYFHEYPYIVLIVWMIKSVETLSSGTESYIDLLQGQEAFALSKSPYRRWDPPSPI